jgi:hypothetical protein
VLVPSTTTKDGAVAGAWRALWISRLVVFGCGAFAVLAWGVRDRAAEAFDPDGVTRPFGALGDALVAPGARWDAMWFLRIADEGYEPDPDRAAFFPLYPLLVRSVGGLLGSDVVAGILVSVAALFGALVLLHRLVALDFGRDVARLTVLLVAIFPGALWFSSVYSEGLFLLLSVAAVWFARTDRWLLAGLLGALAAGTRSAGIVLVVPLAVLWWRSGRRPADLAGVALIPLGLLAFCAYCAAAGLGFGAPFDAQDAWFREFAGPFGAVPAAASAAWDAAGSILRGDERPTFPYDPARVNLQLFVELLVYAVALAGALWKLPRAYALYALAALAIPLSYPVEQQPLMSLPRFVAVLWPLHLWLAIVLVRRARARAVIIGVMLVLLGATSAYVARWGWIA